MSLLSVDEGCMGNPAAAQSDGSFFLDFREGSVSVLERSADGAVSKFCAELQTLARRRRQWKNQ